MKFIASLTLIASAAAFAPAPFGARVNTAVFSAPGGYGKVRRILNVSFTLRSQSWSSASQTVLPFVLYTPQYDDTLWDSTSKNDVYNDWDPNSPRSPTNFNPFETFGGNSPDASGYYPGEGFYKDPVRGDINFAQMMVEREEAEARTANPKAGDAPGCPGCRN